MHAERLDRSRCRCGRSARYAKSRPRCGAAGLYHAPAGPGSAAGAARRRQHLGEDASLPISMARPSTCSASRAPAGTWASIEPAGLPAVRLAPLLKLRAREKLSDEEMVRLQRANLIDPDGAESFRRGAAARFHSAQIRRPHPFDRGARAHRPARWRSLVPRSLRQAGGLCALHHAGFWSRKGRGRRVRCGSVASKAWCWSSTASSVLAPMRAKPMSA